MMKRFLLIAVCALSLAAVCNAQPKALGARLGWGVDVSYEHYLKGASSDFLEFDLGLSGWSDSGFSLDGVWNFMIATPDWTSVGQWGFYGGPGASLALVSGDDGSVYAGVLGNLGLEYTLDTVPLQLSLDVRPRILMGGGKIWSNGIFSFGLGVRYAF